VAARQQQVSCCLSFFFSGHRLGGKQCGRHRLPVAVGEIQEDSKRIQEYSIALKFSLILAGVKYSTHATVAIFYINTGGFLLLSVKGRKCGFSLHPVTPSAISATTGIQTEQKLQYCRKRYEEKEKLQ
jgi:hypothetical protein